LAVNNAIMQWHMQSHEIDKWHSAVITVGCFGLPRLQASSLRQAV